MSKLRVLHIVPWFPNPNNKVEGIFIVEHIISLNKFCINNVLHIQFGSKNKQDKDVFEDIEIERITLKPIINKWILKEILAAKQIYKILKKDHSKYDLVNFQIAYPNAIKINVLEHAFPKLNFVITEHWTAYSNGFNLTKGSKGRDRIENIFNNSVPLFVVSNALGHDIGMFINNDKRKFNVIPNVIDCDRFIYKQKSSRKEFVFLSINNWNPMKNPFVLIKAFKLLQRKYSNLKLILGGSGSLDVEMKQLITELNIENSVKLIGRLKKEEVVNILHDANVYCQSSNYETFSVICAEALITGTPVVATRVGGMLDFINDSNGILVNDLEVESWFEAMERSYLKYNEFDNEKIAKECADKFNREAVGKLYYSKLMDVYNGK